MKKKNPFPYLAISFLSLFLFQPNVLKSMKIENQKELTFDEKVQLIIQKSSYLIHDEYLSSKEKYKERRNARLETFASELVQDYLDELQVAYHYIPPGKLKSILKDKLRIKLYKTIKKEKQKRKALRRKLKQELYQYIYESFVEPNVFNNWFNKKREDHRSIRYILKRTFQIINLRILSTSKDFPLFTCKLENGMLETIFRIAYFNINEKEYDDINIEYLHAANNNLVGFLNYSIIFSGKLSAKLPPLEIVLELAPYIYKNFYTITTLLLNDNDLKELPKTIRCLKYIEEIHLQNNQLETLPFDSILNLKNLKKLIIDEKLYKKLPTNFLSELEKRNISIKTK